MVNAGEPTGANETVSGADPLQTTWTTSNEGQPVTEISRVSGAKRSPAGVADSGIGSGSHIGALVAPERKGQAEGQTEPPAKLDARGAS